jgi:hypothetical protein
MIVDAIGYSVGALGPWQHVIPRGLAAVLIVSAWILGR